MRRAVVELGNTAIWAVVAEPTPGGWRQVRAEHRVVLGLGRAIRRDGHLGEGLLQLTEETLRRLREALFRDGVRPAELHGVVAAGLADAADLDELCERAAGALAAPVVRRDGAAEARQLVVALRRASFLPATGLVVDLGAHGWRLLRTSGAEVQVLAQDPAAAVPGSLPVGSMDPLHPAARAALVRTARALLRDRTDPTCGSDDGWPVVAGSAVEALGRVLQARRWGRAVPHVAGTRVSIAALEGLEGELASVSPAQRLLLPAVDPVEVDLVAATALVLAELLRGLRADGAVIGTASTMDGQVLELLHPAEGASSGVAPVPAPPRDAALTDAGVSPHGWHSGHLAVTLFDQLRPLLGLADADRRLVHDGAVLHDLGCRRDAGASHRLAADELLRDGLRGVPPHELVELACLVRFARGRDPSRAFEPFTRLTASRRAAIERACVLVRLACGLDRGHDGVVTDVLVDHDPELVCLHLRGTAPLDLALLGVRAELRRFERVLGVAAVARAISPTSPAPTSV